MAERELTDTEKQMGGVLKNHYMAPEVKFERLLEIVEALVNENLAPALSRARAEALEGAGHDLRKRAEAAEEMGCLAAGEVWRNAESAVRALIAAPAPATIPVERVRDEARLMLGSRTLISEPVKAVHTMLERLGVDFDAKETCRYCKGAVPITNDRGDIRCSGCGRDWAPVSP